MLLVLDKCALQIEERRQGALLLGGRGHVFDHLAGELSRNVFKAWLDEHIAV